jgi:hypothetical protein
MAAVLNMILSFDLMTITNVLGYAIWNDHTYADISDIICCFMVNN